MAGQMSIHHTTCAYRLRRYLIAVALILSAAHPNLTCAKSAKGIRVLQSRIKHTESEINALPDLLQTPSPWTLGYRSDYSEEADHKNTIDIRFASPEKIDLVALLPATFTSESGAVEQFGFPKRFTIESVLPDGSTELIADYSQQNYPIHGIEPQLFHLTEPMVAGGIRITTLRQTKDPSLRSDQFITAFSEIMAFSGDWNVALGANVDVSSQLPFGYVWHRDCLVDGFSLFSPLTRELRSHFNNFYFPAEQLTVTFDLGETRHVDELRIWPVILPQQHHFPNASGIGFPRRVQFERLNQLDEQAGLTLYQTGLNAPWPGSGPLMVRFPAVPGRYFRLSLRDPVPDFRSSRPPRINLGEIEIVGQGHVLTRGNRPGITSEGQRITKKKRLSAAVLTDGRTAEGDILPLRSWIEGLTRRARLERYLTELQLDLRFAQQQERERLVFSIILSGCIIVILVSLIWLVRLIAKQRWTEVRDRISCDLHDEIGANASSLVHTTELIQETVPEPTTMQTKLFNDAIETARLTARETRNFINFLESDKPCFDICGQIRNIAQRMLGIMDYRCEFGVQARLTRMRPSEQWDLLMFVKEALNNIIKHADASHVEILTRKRKKDVQLIITDNGQGIPDERLPLRHLEARAEQLHARLDIETGLHKGTRLTLTLK